MRKATALKSVQVLKESCDTSKEVLLSVLVLWAFPWPDTFQQPVMMSLCTTELLLRPRNGLKKMWAL